MSDFQIAKKYPNLEFKYEFYFWALKKQPNFHEEFINIHLSFFSFT
jgi:hypothetical protein